MPCSPTASRSRSATHRQRLVDEVDTVGVQDVEEPRPQDLGARTRRPEAAHRLLERPRRAVLVERQRLAVEDERSAREGRDDLDELRHPRGDVGQRPAEHLDPTARPAMAVHLDPSAVELDLDRHRRRPECRHGFAGRGGRRRQHRQQGDAHREPHPCEVGTGQREVCRPPQAPGQHRRPPDLLQRAPGSLRHRIGEHPF
jgi:hypothetical protein